MRYRNNTARAAVNRYVRSNDFREAVYGAILAYAAEHGGTCPTLKEIMEATGLRSTSAASYHVHVLIAMERLEIRDRKLIVCGAQWIAPPPEGEA